MEDLLSTGPTPSSLSCTIEAISIYFVQKKYDSIFTHKLLFFRQGCLTLPSLAVTRPPPHLNCPRFVFTRSTIRMALFGCSSISLHFCCFYSLRSTPSCQPGLQRTTGVHCTVLHCTVTAQLIVEGPVLHLARVHRDLHPVTPLTSVITAACRRQPEQNWNCGSLRRFSRESILVY